MEFLRRNLSFKKKGVWEVVYRETPNILILQEVKLREVDKSFLGSIWQSRFKEWVLLPAGAVGRLGGILVVWDVKRMKVVESFSVVFGHYKG